MRKFHCQAQSAQKVKMRHCFLQRRSVFETRNEITRRGWSLRDANRGSLLVHGTRITRSRDADRADRFWFTGRGSRGSLLLDGARITRITSGSRGADHADHFCLTGRGSRGSSNGRPITRIHSRSTGRGSRGSSNGTPNTPIHSGPTKARITLTSSAGWARMERSPRRPVPAVNQK